MANEYLVKGESLTAVADKIRILNGTTEPLTLDEMAEALDGIEIGVELPELSNPASAEEVFLNKEFIDEDGNSITGTFSIDNELSNQDNLISQIQTALQNKATATGEDVTSETIAYTTKLATLETAITALETELQGKVSGGSGGGSIKTCTVHIHSSSSPVWKIYCSTFSGDSISYAYSLGPVAVADVTIENVVVGTYLRLFTTQVVTNITTDNCEVFASEQLDFTVGIAAPDGGMATINLSGYNEGGGASGGV